MIRIHVVNSVKGGCGKSTWCLLLADYLYAKGHKPFIIDLDLCGSSWLSDKKNFFVEKPEDIITINDLMRNTSKGMMDHFITHIRVARETRAGAFHTYQLPICVANPFELIKQDEEHLDIFEHTIAKIMEYFINASFEKGEYKDIDIIMDMPPGREPHAEVIIKHMLFDINSPWVKITEQWIKSKTKSSHKAIKKTVSDGWRSSKTVKEMKDVLAEGKQVLSHEDFEFYLYMLSGVTYSGVSLNARYIKELYDKKTYSSQIDELLKKENILFVANDLTKVFIKNNSNQMNELETTLYTNAKEKFSLISLGHINNLSELSFLPHPPKNIMPYYKTCNVLEKKAIDEFKNKTARFFKPKDW